MPRNPVTLAKPGFLSALDPTENRYVGLPTGTAGCRCAAHCQDCQLGQCQAYPPALGDTRVCRCY
ncbi:MAG: hypothetical protein MUC60_14815 [Oscillatoria sp. Prado101]|nr:hypothetical protein [Oscillatoria sp. Prado101]